MELTSAVDIKAALLAGRTSTSFCTANHPAAFFREWWKLGVWVTVPLAFPRLKYFCVLNGMIP
jgi:hypothetical protein